MSDRKITLHGRIILRMDVLLLTGLHIGGAAGGLEIGGVDSPVIRDPLTGRPYIPGSSVRGKMRSLTERVHGDLQNFSVGKDVFIHMIQQKKDESEIDFQKRFRADKTCAVFGTTGDTPVPHPTALIVRDSYMSEESATRLSKAHTDLPFSEVKWEATIDRVTSAATPRQIERVPAGARFENLELVYSLYERSNLENLPVVLNALSLVEEDYLGGLGSRGSGKVRFEIKDIFARKGASYDKHTYPALTDSSLSGNHQAVLDWANELFANL